MVNSNSLFFVYDWEEEAFYCYIVCGTMNVKVSISWELTIELAFFVLFFKESPKIAL